MKSLLFIALVVFALCKVEGKHFTRCQLVQELRRQHFPEDKMRSWVCLIEAESSRSTDKVNSNKNGSKDYGLFQINDKFWCSSSSSPGKDCHVRCSDLLKDDITAAASCALKVYHRHGFRAWYGWRNRCQNTLPDIHSC